MAKKKSSKKKTSALTEADVRNALKTLADMEDLEDALDALDILLEETDTPGEQLARLAVFDLDPQVAAGASTALALALDNEYFELKEVESIGKQAGPILIKALENPKVPDGRKVDIVRLCGLAGWLPEEANVSEYFEDLDGTMQNMLEKGLETFEGTPEDVEAAVLGLQERAEEDVPPIVLFAAMCEMAQHIARNKPAAAAALAAATILFGVQESLEKDDLGLVLSLLEKQQVPEAVWWLEALAKWPNIGPIGEEARRLAARKRMEGLASACSFQRSFQSALISAYDPAGARQILMTFVDADGEQDGLCILSKNTEGVVDAYLAYGDGEIVVEKTLEMGEGMALAECSKEVALEFLADACALNVEARTMPALALFIYLPYFGPLPEPKFRPADLTAYDDTVPRTEDMVAGSDNLQEGAILDAYAFASDASYDFLRRHGPKRGSKLAPAKFDAFLASVEAVEKPILMQRLTSVLEIEALAGKAQNEEYQLAFRVLLALEENVVPFASIPYVRLIAERTLDVVLENIRMGFKSQREANEAALALQETLHDDSDEEF